MYTYMFETYMHVEVDQETIECKKLNALVKEIGIISF